MGEIEDGMTFIPAASGSRGATASRLLAAADEVGADQAVVVATPFGFEAPTQVAEAYEASLAKELKAEAEAEAKAKAGAKAPAKTTNKKE